MVCSDCARRQSIYRFLQANLTSVLTPASPAPTILLPISRPLGSAQRRHSTSNSSPVKQPPTMKAPALQGLTMDYTTLMIRSDPAASIMTPSATEPLIIV